MIPSDVPAETEIVLYQVAFTFVFSLSIFIILLAGYIILNTGKNIKTYRWYLLAQLIASAIFDLVYWLKMPVELYSAKCIYSVGLLGETPLTTQNVQFVLIVFFGECKLLVLYAAIMYRYYHGLPPDTYPRLRVLVEPKIYKFALLFLVVQLPVVLSLVPSLPMPARQAVLRNRSPLLRDVYIKHPSLLCFEETTQNTKEFDVMFVFLTASYTFIIVTLIFMMSHLIYLTNQNKNRHNSTYRIQFMLFKSIRMQFFCMIVVTVIPLTYRALATSFEFRREATVLMAMCVLTCSHSVIDCALMIHYVRPYRQMLTHIVLKCLNGEMVSPGLVTINSRTSGTFGK
ncbi:unnamed protein product [Bursaphelenchus xylophilus]|uniref:(pine wood nematode) hypothetical protein n=1 Tax=Bursaphelenchus xylophilus TaxID=6326 RepID=A0A1I7SUP8_BURXY|nr:unnamed protein product [Bursaphelenchus xylophilus]CAG9125969.1 unnamed protein product [Bursaphelenchus xylophilus]